MTPVDYLPLAVAVSQAAGELLKSRFSGPFEVLDDRGKDIKIQADREAECLIIEQLRRIDPVIPILSEEAGLLPAGLTQDNLLWVIDPLDGTLNYSRGLPLCCVSVALCQASRPVVGVVNEFLHGRIFSGAVDAGAWCNGSPIHVSQRSHPDQAVIVTGFPAHSDFGTAALNDFVRQVQAFKKVRLLGSAALSLAQVAAGHADLYVENGIHFWDVAAGLALVKAAGGNYSASKPDSSWRCRVVAGNGQSTLSTALG